MPRSYPQTIEHDGITLTQLPEEWYVEFQPTLGRAEIDHHLQEEGFLRKHGRPENRRELTVERFNRASARRRWLTRAARGKKSFAQAMGSLEKDKAVALVRPIYCRKDLPYPTGFCFSDKIIVKAEEGLAEAELQRCLHQAGAERIEGRRGKLGRGLRLARILGRANPCEVAQTLQESRSVEWARPSLLQLHPSLLAFPNDTLYANQWNLHNSGQFGTAGCDINIEPAWEISTGSPLVVIAILDTGCDLTHPDLAPQLVQAERWYNAVTEGQDAQDDNGHGTWCAGIASALTDSLAPQGVAGVGWHCRLMPVRMVWDNGAMIGETEIAHALDWAREHDAHVINMSWHWDGSHGLIDTALDACASAGIVLCAGSGSYGGLSAGIAYPASHAGVISVGTTNENDLRCKGAGQDWPGTLMGSQYGPSLSVVAPGVHIWTTDRQGINGGYNQITFEPLTSPIPPGEMFPFPASGATPHAAGLAGLMLAYDPTLLPAQVKTIMENTANKQAGGSEAGSPLGYMGQGRIDAGQALAQVALQSQFTPADVYIRDSLNDLGEEPYLDWDLCMSPDIIVRNTSVTDPATAFSDMSVDPGSDAVEIGNDNYIYLRVHNRGTVATDIHARVYFAPLATTCSPEQWQYIGQLDIPDVGAGSDAVSGELVWPSVPDPGAMGHFCLIASIEGARDPHPDPAGISDASQYLQFIRDHNNICYRNLVFQNLLPDSVLPVPFQPGGIGPRPEPFDLRIEREGVAQRAAIHLDLPRRMFKGAHVRLEDMVERADGTLPGFRRLELKDEKRPAVKGLAMSRRERAQLEIHMPADARPGEEYKLVVQQLFQGEVIGGFQVAGKIADPKKVEFVAVRGSHFVHRAECAELKKAPKSALLPFDSLQAARVAGYDTALDCLAQRFAAKDVSHRLARKVLYFVNVVELPEELEQAVKQALETRPGKGARKKAGIGLETARLILEARDRKAGFRRLQEIEEIPGLDQEEFMHLVNAFK